MDSLLFRWWFWLSESLRQKSAWASLQAAAIGPLPAVCQRVLVSAMCEHFFTHSSGGRPGWCYGGKHADLDPENNTVCADVHGWCLALDNCYADPVGIHKRHKYNWALN